MLHETSTSSAFLSMLYYDSHLLSDSASNLVVTSTIMFEIQFGDCISMHSRNHFLNHCISKLELQ